jgi:WD40 repeat protein
VQILFHREKSKLPWAHNPAIRIPGLEATVPAKARTLVCIEESRLEMGKYESGEPGYAPAWDVTIVRLSDHKVYFMRGGFYGEMPPYIKWNRGAGVGKPPTEAFVRWMRVLFQQKVARLKQRLKLKEYHDISAMDFSADGSRLAVAQEPRSTSDGTPPTPVTVFDLNNGQPVASMHVDFSLHALALSKSGSILALNRYGGIQIWDVATQKLTSKLDTHNVESLMFGPDDRLAVAGKESAAIWDINANRMVHSGKGSVVQLTPEGTWLALSRVPKNCGVSELESGRELGRFSCSADHDTYAISRDGKSVLGSSILGAAIYTVGGTQTQYPSLPDLGVGTLGGIAAVGSGFIVANHDGIAGLVSISTPEARAFATDLSAIHAVAVSRDGKLVALGDSSANVEIWELE